MLRLDLHQFRAFKRMFDDGMTKEAIADAYRTTLRYITRRMRLVSVSPALWSLCAQRRNWQPNRPLPPTSRWSMGRCRRIFETYVETPSDMPGLRGVGGVLALELNAPPGAFG